MSDPLRDTENPMVLDPLWRWEERLHEPEEDRIEQYEQEEEPCKSSE